MTYTLKKLKNPALNNPKSRRPNSTLFYCSRLMTTLQEYYEELSNTEWVRYVFYIFLIVFSMVTLYKIIPEEKDANSNGFDIDDSTTHADQDKKYLYTLSDGKVAKYKRKTGKKKLEKNVSFSNMVGIKAVEGNLIILNSANKKTMVIVMDPRTLNTRDHFTIPNLTTNIRWFDVYNGNMWLFGGGLLYCFDKDWEMIGFWKLPKFLKHTNYGYLYDDLLYTGTPKVHYALELPPDEIKARVVETMPAPEIPLCFINIERPAGRIEPDQYTETESEYDLED